MKILVMNAGSSSIKYQLIDMENENLLAKGLVERIGEQGSKLTHKVNGVATEIVLQLNNHYDGLKLVLKTLVDNKIGVIKSLNEISAVGHRVLHGATKYKKATLINNAVLKDLKSFIPLGPLHMPANIQGIEACQNVMPGVVNVAVFDTAFHATMPDYAYMYAVPYSWYEKYNIRKYGFHGTSHDYVSHELARVLGKDIKDLKIISCHIGSGASIAAIKNGKCIDTSMGFTPLEGLMMGTRCGDIDPALIEHIMEETGLSIKEVMNILNTKSGLLGLSEVSNDIRDVLKAERDGNEKARLAIDKFVYVIKKYIGAYSASMGGVDAIAFTAGTGENRDDIREKIMENMEYLGIDFDKELNRNFVRSENFKISKDNSKVAVYVIPTDEELTIARQTKEILNSIR